MIGRVGYGALFVLLIPILLALWARSAEGNVSLPIYGTTAVGLTVAGLGFGLMASAMWQLWRKGEGLPMNAFPPKKLVAGGLFAWLPHPIYVGFTALCFGVSMAEGSAAGLWLVTPCVALGCAALVVGYERLDLQRRLGDTLHLLPADEVDGAPSILERVRFVAVVIVPWLLLYEFTIHLGLPGRAFGMAWEDSLPVIPWTAIIYESCYLAVLLAPWVAGTRRDLRRLMISAWVAMVLVFPIYWFLPSAAPRRTIPEGSWAAWVLGHEQSAYPAVAALPSFHLLWAILVGRLFRWRWLGWAYAAAMAVSCVTTGMHSIADLASALMLAPLVLWPEKWWRGALNMAERLANSWQEWRMGGLRIINHSVYAGMAGMVQILAMSAVLAPGHEWKAFAAGMAGLVGAGVWAQWVEGSSLLRRPFGFYGGLIGVGLCCLIFEERWLLLGACCLSAPWMQALGRLRCLVNGCCHGAPAAARYGIRVTHPRSRVTRLAHLTGVPIHATQLYSIVGNVFVGLLLLRLWMNGCAVPLICGVYGMGNGLARFVEEGYRGEPQTKIWAGLRLYQWMAIATLVSGAILSTLDGPAAEALRVSWAGAAWAIGFGCLAGAAMGIDFPEADAPLARLA